MDVFLQTGRMLLRRFVAQDVDVLVELDSDPEVMRYLNGGLPTSSEAIETTILPAFLRSYEPAGFGVFAAIEKQEGSFLGWFSLRPVNGEERDVASVGYRLRRAVWKRGYATEGVRALICRAFTESTIQRVIATTYEHNIASRRVMEKAGLILVRRYRMTMEELGASETTVHDESEALWDGDDVEYALSRGEWER